jgi:hypothetical protein
MIPFGIRIRFTKKNISMEENLHYLDKMLPHKIKLEFPLIATAFFLVRIYIYPTQFSNNWKGYCKQVNQAGPMCPPKGLPVSEQCILNALSLPALSSHSQLRENNIAVTRPAWAVAYCFLGSRWLQSADKVNSCQSQDKKFITLVCCCFK